MFVAICILLGLGAAAFVAWPLLGVVRSGRGGVDQGAAHDDAIRALYRARVEEVSSETDDQDLLDELRSELGAVLLSEQTEDRLPSAPIQATSRWLIALALFIPVLGAGLYLQVSNPGLQAIRGAEAVLSASEEDVAELQSWQIRLSAWVAQHPQDNKSWYLLGHSYLKLGRFADAAEAFATTAGLAGDDLNVLLYWLRARYLNNRGLLDEVSHGLADKLLAEHPNFPVVLEILALDAFRREAYADSIRFLHRALASTSDLNQQGVFATAIEQVRDNMKSPPPGVTVEVSARGRVPGEATVFVIARPVGGGMPYAVIRRSAGAVPFTARLDDLASMSEARLLSSAVGFEVIVRLSHTGMAMAQQGDWQWKSAELNLAGGELPVLQAQLSLP